MQVTGARPQFIKAAVVYHKLRELGSQAPLVSKLVHTGQHYDTNLSDTFFEQLGLPEPDFHLGIGNAPPHSQFGLILERLTPILEQERPSGVLVYGDTTSTLAAAVASQYLNLPLIHVEAGERLFARVQQPEELNRILTDHAAWLCLTATGKARDFLLEEGMDAQRARFVGDLMYDLLRWGLQRCEQCSRLTLAGLGLAPGRYHLATLHRAENTAGPDVLLPLLNALDTGRVPVVLPVHPRTAKVIQAAGWQPQANLKLIEPVGYFELLVLLKDCSKVVTDSGGLTREAFWTGKPAILPVAQTCWQEIVDCGWAVISGADPVLLSEALAGFQPATDRPSGVFGDGHAAERIITETAAFLANPCEPALFRHGSH
jgi:UDP-N-acetylglucosamine 2-epimerase